MNESISNVIATDEILWLRRDGSEVLIKVVLGAPCQVGEDEWACPAWLQGVDSRYPDIRGETSLQALCLAVRLISTRLWHLLESGENLVYPGDRSCRWTTESLCATFGLPSD